MTNTLRTPETVALDPCARSLLVATVARHVALPSLPDGDVPDLGIERR
ncbi:hypothetical protein J2S43_002328 [Catenuloplanes nepalensis]|uniref:Uncharacterized protein n=1 Tax=Catenuloplanes nepalensis TaxID=587533 RepID=A0ABT9MR87_9ACTN|nr:hypothetical protein [Catenuloplanes nepalensis]MDP9793816.1 hypothetical protein [Catenuloplanes nepalensis]